MKSIEFGNHSQEAESKKYNLKRLIGRAAAVAAGILSGVLMSHATANAEELNINQLNPGSAMQLEAFLSPEITGAINGALEQATLEQQQAIGAITDSVEDTVYTFAPEVVPGDLNACDDPNVSNYSNIQCAVGQTEQYYQEVQGEDYIQSTTFLTPKLGVGLTINPENPTDFCGYAPILGDHACDNAIFLTNPELQKESPTAEEYTWLIAHERNHIVQEQEGENVSITLLKTIASGDPMSDSSPFEFEQRSDCAAGVQAAWSEQMGYSDAAQTERGADYIGSLSAGDQDMNHGTLAQRAGKYKEGSEEKNLAVCSN